jgi:hypothetical protein
MNTAQKHYVLENVNHDYCRSIRRIVEGVIARTACSADEAIVEVAASLGIRAGAVELAIAVTNEVGRE